MSILLAEAFRCTYLNESLIRAMDWGNGERSYMPVLVLGEVVLTDRALPELQWVLSITSSGAELSSTSSEFGERGWVDLTVDGCELPDSAMSTGDLLLRHPQPLHTRW